MIAKDRPRPPSVGRVLELVRARQGVPIWDADETGSLAELVRAEVAIERDRLAAGEPPRTPDAIAAAVEGIVDSLLTGEAAAPMAVINATGVVLHTNLGRAPWPEAAIAAAREAATHYTFLELDQETGRRGPRFRLAEDHLVALTGAADALVVNNNAAALALAVGLAGPGGGVLVSRGELVEIGGGVRIPDIIERAGARLIEVGTTNRTRVADFERHLVDGSASVVLRVHPSNFTMAGFIEEPDAAALAALAHAHGAIVIDDLGSGALLDTAAFGLLHEPTPRERLAAADVVTFSGDKLVGGPQVGLLVGGAALITRLRRDPLARAMRPDKAILAAVAATLGLYRVGVAAQEIPIWQRIATPAAALEERARWIASMCAAWFAADAGVTVVPLRSPIGGGSLPGQTVPSFGVSVPFPSASDAAAALRLGDPSILTRIEDGSVVFDLRTVSLGGDGDIVRRISEIVHGQG